MSAERSLPKSWEYSFVHFPSWLNKKGKLSPKKPHGVKRAYNAHTHISTNKYAHWMIQVLLLSTQHAKMSVTYLKTLNFSRLSLEEKIAIKTAGRPRGGGVMYLKSACLSQKSRDGPVHRSSYSKCSLGSVNISLEQREYLI